MMATQSDCTSTAKSPSPKFQAGSVIFDLDGTLVHTGPDIAAAANLTLRDLGRPPYSEDEILTWVGDGARALIKRALTGLDDSEPEPELLDRADALFKRHYLARVCELSRPYPGVVDTLDVLRRRGFLLSCVTNKVEAYTAPLLRGLEMDRWFEHVVSGDSLAEKKPHPMPLLHICEQSGIPVSRTLLVGDSANDIAAAKGAGMPVVCVRYGYNQGMDLTQSRPDVIIDAFHELPDLLEFHS